MAREFTNKDRETAKMIVRFFNMQAGTGYRYNGSDDRTEIIMAGLEKCDGSLAVYKDNIKTFCKEKNPVDDFRAGKSFEDVFADLLDMIEMEKMPEAVQGTDPAPAPAPVVTDQSVAGALGIIEQAVTKVIVEAQSEKIKADIMDSVQQSVRDFVKSEYGVIERKIITVVDGKRVPQEGILHEKFDEVVKFVANDEPVFLTGPAGSGKNVLCKQVAEALGLNFYFTNAVTQEYKLTGFTDAMGNYQPTQFYKAFTQGGLFMLDEMDASIPEVLVILNAAIANRYFDFPAPIGYVEAHPNFRVVAAGNTVGTGASYEYVGRNQLDAASLDRFAVVEINYSEAIENSVAGDIELADFCRAFRKEARKAGQQVVVSYRGIGRLAKMMQILSLEEALKSCLIKGMEKDDLNIIAKELPDSKYTVAVRKIVRHM